MFYGKQSAFDESEYSSGFNFIESKTQKLSIFTDIYELEDINNTLDEIVEVKV